MMAGSSWLRGAHAQTIWPALFLKGRLPTLRREWLRAPDGEYLALDFLADAPVSAPLVVLFHGLEGSSRSHYARALMRHVAERSWQGVVVHFRGCGGAECRLPRAYHAGDSDELAWLLPQLAVRAPVMCAVGVSLGGNVLLKYLGEQAQRAQAVPLCGAAAISVPFDLTVTGDTLDNNSVNCYLYTRHFLRSLKPNITRLRGRYPHILDWEAVQRCQTLREFDDLVTAPLHGYADVVDYWRRASAKPWLSHITVPTLLVQALNDPFVPASSLPTAAECAECVVRHYVSQGGHAGFVSGAFPGTIMPLPKRILEFFSSLISLY